MSPQPQTPCKAAALAALCLALAPLTLPAQKTLQDDSPFLPPGYGISKTPPPPQVAPQGQIARSLELRGLMRIGANYTLSFFDKQTQKSFWIEENKSHPDGYRVGRYNPDNLSIPVTKNGRTEQITLISSSNTPSPVNASVNLGSSPRAPAKPTIALPKPNNQTKKNVRSIPRRRVILPKK
ncbi:MAG: hypothetical protein ACPGGJ_00950 [Coraliomargarita sp.]